MNKFKLSLTLLLLVAFGVSGCATGVTPETAGQAPIGIFTDVEYSNQAMNNEVGDQRGESCEDRILIFSSGEVTLRDAAADAGVSEIGSVSNSYTNILGLYEQRCVVVTGS